MMRALWAGVSGLKNHQTRMDVIGNNIANVNTVGFKASRVTFQDMLSQTIQGAGAPSGSLGGTNPMQIGMGMALASVDTIFTDGAAQATGNQTDLAISGQGFFQVSKDGGVTKEYTRDGAFGFDSVGNYVIPNTGYKVMGYTLDASGNPSSAAGPITISKTDLMPAKVSTTLDFIGNLSASATAAVAATAAEVNSARDVSIAVNGALAAAIASGTDPVVAIQTAITNIPGGLAPLTLAAYNAATTAPVPTGASIATAMSMNLSTQIKAANVTSDDAISFKVYSTSGNAYNLNGTLEKTDANEWTFTPTSTITDSTGSTIANVTVLPAATAPAKPAPMVIKFTADGKFASSLPANYQLQITPVVSPAAAAGPDPFTLTPDFSTLTQYDSKTTAMASATDGYGAGTLDKLSISSSGKFSATYSNGVTKDLAQVALFTFNNPAGLDKSGGNMYTQSSNSGIATKDQSSTVNPGNLEMSNVDLAQQFSDMIVTQRGFQANSKIITTTDSMLEELVNLKR